MTSAVLVAFASGYGYHRDEPYFLAAGHHLDWWWADQGPAAPLIARGMSEIAPNSLTVLRLPSALAAGLTVLLTGLLAREFGGSRRATSIAAACAAAASLVLFTGHLLSTSTFDLLAWSALTGEDRLWLIAGVILGVGLLNKPLRSRAGASRLARARDRHERRDQPDHRRPAAAGGPIRSGHRGQRGTRNGGHAGGRA